jgi:T4 RnlA family RNA ligase
MASQQFESADQLYNDLIKLVQTNEAFFFQDSVVDGKKYRIFNYRLASYQDFQLPSALECRGIMFEIPNEIDGVPGAMMGEFRLASLPMEKFFNLYENPLTMNLDLTEVVEILEKVDGSLISTFMHNGELRLKTKGSVGSPQAIAAMQWLARREHSQFKSELIALTNIHGLTINLEWLAPDNQIVIPYDKAELRVLNARERSTGRYLDLSAVKEKCPALLDRLVAGVNVDNPVEFVNRIPNMVQIEGFVLRLLSGQRVKVKTAWYLSLHRGRDSVTNPKALFDLILDEGIDDIRSMFHEQVTIIQRIDWMQEFIDRQYNHFVGNVERFYEENKDGDRKSFAIKGQAQLERMEFQMAMSMYGGGKRNVTFKSIFKSAWETKFKALVSASPFWNGAEAASSWENDG